MKRGTTIPELEEMLTYCRPHGSQTEADFVEKYIGTIPGVAYDKFHQLYVALPNGFGPPPAGTIMKISPNGEQATAVPGSEGMVAPDGFGLDPAPAGIGSQPGDPLAILQQPSRGAISNSMSSRKNSSALTGCEKRILVRCLRW